MGEQLALESYNQLVNQFFYYLDERRYEDMIDMLSTDAVWFRRGIRHRGHEDIRSMLNERSTTMRIRHVLTNGFVDKDANGGPRFRAYMLGYRYDDGVVREPPLTISGPIRMLLTEAKFVPTPAGLRIGEVSVIPEFEFSN